MRIGLTMTRRGRKFKLNIFLTTILATINLLAPKNVYAKQSEHRRMCFWFENLYFLIIAFFLACRQRLISPHPNPLGTQPTAKMFNHVGEGAAESLLNWGWNRIIFALFEAFNVILHCKGKSLQKETESCSKQLLKLKILLCLKVGVRILAYDLCY